MIKVSVGVLKVVDEAYYLIADLLWQSLGVILSKAVKHTRAVDEAQRLLGALGIGKISVGVSCGVGYTLQIIGQKYVPSTIASLIMSLESVIAALAGWILLHEVLTKKELTGCGLVFIAVLLTQIPVKSKKSIGN